MSRIRPTSSAGIVDAAPGSTGRDEGRQAGGVRRQEARDALGVESVTERDRVGDRVGREQLESDRDVTERQVEVDQADLTLAPVGEHSGEVGGHRGLATPSLRREHRDDAAPGAVQVAPLGRVHLIAHGPGELPGTPHGGAQPGDVPLFDDLADPGAQRLRQHRGVDAASDEHEAEARPDHPHRLSKREGGALVDRGADHDTVLAQVGVQVSAQGVDTGQHLRLSPQRGVERVRASGVEFDDDSHRWDSLALGCRDHLVTLVPSVAGSLPTLEFSVSRAM